MQQFTVPQFIDVEDKIIGPITTRQFVILLSAAILAAIFYKIFDFSLFVVSVVLTLGVAGVFSFARINGRPFHYFVLNFIQTLKRPKLRVWKAGVFAGVEVEEKEEEIKIEHIQPRKFGSSRLAELSLIVDTRGVYQGEGGDESTAIERGSR